MSHQCRACNGKRTYDVHTYKMHGGVRCGSEITLLYPCPTCKGSGVIHCLYCEDTGYMPEFDHTTGEYEGEYPCLYCDRGRFVEDGNAAYRKRLEDERLDEALDAIDREKAAHEATLPDRDAEMYERVAAGMEPY